MKSGFEIHRIRERDNLIDLVRLKIAYARRLTDKVISAEVALERLLTLEQKGNMFWVAKREGLNVGYSVGVLKDGFLLINGIFVHQDYTEQGVATQLEESQIAYAKEAGLPGVFTIIEKENEASIGLHEKLGFENDGSSDEYILYFNN